MRVFIILAILSLNLGAVEEGASLTPVLSSELPRVGPPQRPMPQQPMTMPRQTMAFEVEVLRVKAGDVAALAQWAELAALGFHVVAVVPGEGQVSVYLERPMMGAAPGSLRLPAVIDPETAAQLKVRIGLAQAERQRFNTSVRPPQSTAEEKN
jgi:hypothetical protein